MIYTISKAMNKIFPILFLILITACSQKSTPVKSNKQASSIIRVMAYNVHHCNPPAQPGIIDIKAIADVITQQNPDLVALQEIDVNTKRSGKFNQAEELAKLTGMKYFFGKGIDYEGGEYGVAILSKYDISDMKVHRLPTQEGTKGEPRVLTTAKINYPGAVIRFGSTHLDAQKADTNRKLQIQEINRIAAEETLPFIIAGDFNDVPGSAVINELDKQFTRTCQQCDPTIPIINPKKAIDFIGFNPSSKFKVVQTRVLNGVNASDHLPVVAEIRIVR